MKTIEATIGGAKAILEVADRPSLRTEGLRLRHSLKPDHGMLFVYPEDSTEGFWMENVSIPLTIAFLNEDKEIIEFMELEPFSPEVVTASVPFRYAIEMPMGWFDEKCESLDCSFSV